MGYSKSLIFPCLVIAVDALFEKLLDSSVLVVISQLRSCGRQDLTSEWPVVPVIPFRCKM